MVTIVVWTILATVGSARRFCGKPEYKTLHHHAVDTNRLAEASALLMSTDLTLFYMFSDSPENNPFIFAHSVKTGLFVGRIDITGITNPHYNGGYGDWEAGVVRACESDQTKMCIVVGDIGHNCVRMDGGMFRLPNQPTRIIEVPEPRAYQLSKDRPLQIAGVEYHFRYPHGWLFDAEAMVVDNEGNLLIVTKNTARRNQYAHIFKFPRLSRHSLVTVQHSAIIQVEYSEVTDATNTGEFLALRTYCGINFYAWDRLHEPNLRGGTGYYGMQWLRDKNELHEGFIFDWTTNVFYFVAEGASRITYLSCPDANPTGATPALTRNQAALDDFAGAADPLLFLKGLEDKKCYKKANHYGENPYKGGRRSTTKEKGKGKAHAEGKEVGSPPHDGHASRPSRSSADHKSSSTERKSRRSTKHHQKSPATNRYLGAEGSKNHGMLCIGDDADWSGDENGYGEREHWRGREEEGRDTRCGMQKDGILASPRKVTRRRRRKKFAWGKTRSRSRERKNKSTLWQKTQEHDVNALRAAHDAFWTQVRAALHATDFDKLHAALKRTENMVDALPQENVKVRYLLADSLKRLYLALLMLVHTSVESRSVIPQQWKNSAGKPMDDRLQVVYRHFVGDYEKRGATQRSERLLQLTNILSMQDTSVLDDVTLAMKSALAAIKYDINNEDVPKTPQWATKVAFSLVDISSTLRKAFTTRINGFANAFYKDVENAGKTPGALSVEYSAQRTLEEHTLYFPHILGAESKMSRRRDRCMSLDPSRRMCMKDTSNT